jgi:N-acetylneuraminic acid mutarotase
MKKRDSSRPAFFNPRVQVAVLLCSSTCSIAVATLLRFSHAETLAKNSQRTLTFEERVAYQRAIEEVYWRHRIWPKERHDPKPSFDAVMSQSQLEKKVAEYLRRSEVLEDYWQRPITAEQFQAEMERMAGHTKQPEVLRELFEALGNDPFVIAECLAKPSLAERLIAHLSAQGPARRFESARTKGLRSTLATTSGNATYILPKISEGNPPCTDDTWTATTTVNAPDARWMHTVVWTGSEMIVWGGLDSNFNELNTGGRYNPATDSWIATSTTNAPAARNLHTAVWTGSEMIVWGGGGATGIGLLNTGGRYNPITDSWLATSTTNAPAPRAQHSAVWTGSEMIVWGGSGCGDNCFFNNGGRYNPTTDTWTATNIANAPEARWHHTAVWTGSEMIVWGGTNQTIYLKNGGRYNPTTDSWTATDIVSAPRGRVGHTAVWTGGEMIVFGGTDDTFNDCNTGGRYNPATDSWMATSTVNAPHARDSHAAVWTGSEMIVWGGAFCCPSMCFNTGGRYDPAADTWTTTSIVNAPTGRVDYMGISGIWIGSEMVIWGGMDCSGSVFNTGGRYCAQSGPPPTPSPTPTPTATPTPAPTTTPTPTPTCTPCPSTTPACTPQPWQVVETMPIDLYGAAGASDGVYFYAAGGYSFSQAETLATFNRYDPVLNTWIPMANMPQAPFMTTAVYYPPTNKLYAFGGEDAATGTNYNITRIYDIASDTWSTGAPMPGVRSFSAGGYIPATGKIYIISGYNTGQVTSAQANTWEYDPVADSWTDLTGTAPFPHPAGGTAFGVINGKLYIAGGRDAYNQVVNLTWEYDPVANTYARRADEPGYFQNDAPGSAAASGALWVFGGGNPFIGASGVTSALGSIEPPPNVDKPVFPWALFKGVKDPRQPATSNAGRYYNPVTDSWSGSSNIHTPRSFPSGGAIGDGLIIAAGGYNGSTTVDGVETEEMCSASATPTPTPTPISTPRASPTARPRPTPPPRPTPR